MKPNFTYVPPHDHEAEAGALACIMDDKRGSMWLSQLERGDWYDLRHTLIYDAMTQLKGMGQYVDTWRVYQRLKDTGQIEKSADLRDYVCNLPNHIPSPENFPLYLATVKDRAWRRKALELLRALALLVCDTATPTTQTKSKMLEAMKDFTKL